MKVVFSRKGWDSSYGGRPSPVFPDKSIQSLPIHDEAQSKTPHNKITLRGLSAQGFSSLARFLDRYHPQPISRCAHLDPDLDFQSVARNPNWAPSFGQSGSPAAHLDKHQVKSGDLFLFYGWFDDIEYREGNWHRRGRDRFLIWGWLQIGTIFETPNDENAPLWLQDHPHVAHSDKRKNRIYSASQELKIGKTRVPGFAGGGIFHHEHPVRCLTHRPGFRGLYPDRVPAWLTAKGIMTRHRQEHVWCCETTEAETYVRSFFV